MRDEVFRIAVETILAGVVIVDAQLPDHPIVYCNPGFVQLTGYSSEEVLGRNCRFLQGPATNPETVARLRRAIHEGRPAHVLLLNYRKDGQPFWNDLRIAPVRDVEGRLTHFVGIQSDVSAKVEGVRLLEQAVEDAKDTSTPITTVHCGANLFALVLPLGVIFLFVPIWLTILLGLVLPFVLLPLWGWMLDHRQHPVARVFLGLWLQRFTVAEPEERHLEAAILAARALKCETVQPPA